MSMESIYEYGIRAGVWRLLRAVHERGLPLTVFAVAMALERHPEAVAAMVEAGHEIASHGWRWIDYQDIAEAEEREHMREAIEILTPITGEPAARLVHRPRQPEHASPRGRGRRLPLLTPTPTPTTCPTGRRSTAGRSSIVPYTLDANDMRFATAQGFNTGEQFFAYLKDSFDVLYAEGDAARPKMLSVGLHCRLVGRPGRVAALAALPRLRRRATTGLVLPPHRHRPPLARTHPYRPRLILVSAVPPAR